MPAQAPSWTPASKPTEKLAAEAMYRDAMNGVMTQV
jgi:hypothetical protein